MADSNSTKHTMAKALKNLLEDFPFEKISVSNICNKCGMNRKSFYYHFKDKYDLVNWIFDKDCDDLLSDQNSPPDAWEVFNLLIHYFYENKSFYQKIIKVKGQNSFSEHLHEFLFPIVHKQLSEIVVFSSAKSDFTINLLANVGVLTVEGWLSEKECISPEEFINIIRSIMDSINKL